MRRAFYLAYDDSNCEYLMPDEVQRRVANGQQVVSATFVTPYPPGFPVLVPGQLFSPQILAFMASLDTPRGTRLPPRPRLPRVHGQGTGAGLIP